MLAAAQKTGTTLSGRMNTGINGVGPSVLTQLSTDFVQNSPIQARLSDHFRPSVGLSFSNKIKNEAAPCQGAARLDSAGLP